MPVATAMREAINSGSMIRKMFEEGNLLKKQHGADKVFDFSLGNPDIEPPPAFNKIFLKLAEENKPGSHGYMNNAGFPEVREALAKKASAEHCVSIDGTHVIMSCGAAGGLNVVCKSILNPGDEIIVSKPYFFEYRSYAGNHGGKIVEVDSLSDFNLDVAALKAKLTPQTAAVIINSPHNPTGRIYPEETIKRLAEALKEHGKKCGRMPYLIADEPYRELVYDDAKVPPILSCYSESIVVNSYSKSLSLPGERIGYIAVSPDAEEKQNLLAAMTMATRTLGFVNAPALMQRIVAELTTAKVDTDIYARRREAFIQVLTQAGIEYSKPEGAFYLFCKTPTNDDLAFVDHLKNYLILGVPGTGFGKPGWMRFAYCIDEKVIKASGEAFKKAAEAWKG
jgi:aspartate aminotransferase